MSVGAGSASGGVAGRGLLDVSVREFLGLLGSSQPAPAAGGAAAVVVGLGARLCAMVASLSARGPARSQAACAVIGVVAELGDRLEDPAPTRPLLLSTFETVCLPTPAARATSSIVTLSWAVGETTSSPY